MKILYKKVPNITIILLTVLISIAIYFYFCQLTKDIRLYMSQIEDPATYAAFECVLQFIRITFLCILVLIDWRTNKS